MTLLGPVTRAEQAEKEVDRLREVELRLLAEKENAVGEKEDALDGLDHLVAEVVRLEAELKELVAHRQGRGSTMTRDERIMAAVIEFDPDATLSTRAATERALDSALADVGGLDGLDAHANRIAHADDEAEHLAARTTAQAREIDALTADRDRLRSAIEEYKRGGTMTRDERIAAAVGAYWSEVALAAEPGPDADVEGALARLLDDALADVGGLDGLAEHLVPATDGSHSESDWEDLSRWKDRAEARARRAEAEASRVTADRDRLRSAIADYRLWDSHYSVAQRRLYNALRDSEEEPTEPDV